ncbi:MAG: DNA translocase FtsK 4TM domain-containing protein, partial [Christensenellales bacterium]
MPRVTKKDLRRKRNLEIIGVVLVVVGLLFGLSIFSTAAGAAGALFRAFSFGMFGQAAYIFPFILLGCAVYMIVMAGKPKKNRLRRVLFWLSLLCALSIFHILSVPELMEETNYWTFIGRSYLQYGVGAAIGGGAVGSLLAFLLKFLFGRVGALIVLFSVIAICLIITTKFSPQKALEQGAEMVRERREVMKEKREQKRRAPLFVETLEGDFSRPVTLADSPREIVFGDFFEQTGQENGWDVAQAPEPALAGQEPKAQSGEGRHKNQTTEAEQIVMQPQPGYVPPEVGYLSFSTGKGRQRRESFKENSVMLEDVLASFGISSKISNVVQGPAITRYELTPAPGVKVSRIVNLADD